MHSLLKLVSMAALIALGARVSLPLGPLSISLQSMAVLLAGFLLGPRRSAVAVALYLTAGAIGLPVFAGGGSGLAHLLGPSGGYLAGFLLSAPVAGLARAPRSGAAGSGHTVGWFAGLAWGGLAHVPLFGLGLGWLHFRHGMNLPVAMDVGLWPFLPGAVVKLVLAASIGVALSAVRGPQGSAHANRRP